MNTLSLHDLPDDEPAGSPLRRQRRLILLGALLLVLALVGGAVALLNHERAVLQQAARDNAAWLAQLLEDQANRSLAGVELALALAGEGLLALPATASADDQTAVLARTVTALPGLLQSLSVVDTQGRVLASSIAANLVLHVPRHRLLAIIEASGLGALQAGADLSDLGLAPEVAGADAEPAAGGLARHWLPLTRGLEGGPLAGWLVAAIKPAHFSAQYAQLLANRPQQALLLSLSGQVIAASPGVVPQPGQRLVDHRVFTEYLPGRGSGQYLGPGVTGEPSFAAFRAAPLLPLVVLIETPVASVTEPLRELAIQVVAVTAVLVMLVLGMTAMVWRSLRGREEVSGDLAAARDSIAAHDAFTDRLFQVSPIAMVVKDTHGRFVRVNKAWTDLTGLPYERVIGVNLGRLYPAQLAAPHMVQEQMAIASGQPVNYEEQILDSDGLPRDVMIRVMPYTDAEGAVAGVITCMTDVTEFREAALRTVEAKNAAEHANLAKSEFLANISHELRTPLQGILGFSELGSRGMRVDPRAQGMFSDIHSAGQRMLSLVNNLLDLSRLESTVGEVVLQPIDIVPALQGVVHELRPLAQRGELRLTATGDLAVLTDSLTGLTGLTGLTEPAAAQPAVRALSLWAAADRFRLQQVLRNVLANAIRFAPAGSTITVTWRQASTRELMVSVRDHGPGIPIPELERIFESFVQSSRTKDGSGGTGLGLAICRKIMRAHRGRISAHNHAEGGAVFEIVLPALPRAPGPQGLRLAAGPAPRSPPSSQWPEPR